MSSSLALDVAYDQALERNVQAREANVGKLEQISTAYAAGRDVGFGGVQKHMRFAWEQASAPLGGLMEDLYDYFNGASRVLIAGGGTHPFNKESVHLSIHLEPVMEVIARDGMGSGLGLLGKYLEDPRFQALCERNGVKDVYTPSNDLEVRAHKVLHHNQPRPL